MHSRIHSHVSVLIGIDGSQQADDAFNWFMENAYQRNHHIILAHCIKPTSTYISDNMMYRRAVGEMKEKAHILKRKYATVLKQREVQGTFQTAVNGNPEEWLSEIARKEHAVLVVVGSHGNALSAMFKRAINGSVSDYIVKHAECAVAVIHSKRVLFLEADIPSKNRSISFQIGEQVMRTSRPSMTSATTSMTSRTRLDSVGRSRHYSSDSDSPRTSVDDTNTPGGLAGYHRRSIGRFNEIVGTG